MNAAFLQRVDALIAAGRQAEAEAALRRELALHPDNAPVCDALGVCLYFQGRMAEAVAAHRRALDLDPERATTWYNLGTALSDDGRAAEAVEAYRRCLARDPGNESAKYNLSRALLLLGQWDEGFRLYEARGRKKRPLYRALDYERWHGEPPGRYVLVLTTEQGIGDAIQFARFAPHLRRAGYEVLLWTAPLLAPLLKQVTGIGPVAAGSGVRIEGAPAKWAPLMSVPAALRLTPETVPAAPYLVAEPARVAHWAQRIGAHGRKIGLVWQGNVAHNHDRRRSMHLSALAPLADIADVRLISLQKRPGSGQIGDVSFADRIETVAADSDLSAEALLDSAAIMAQLDLVVSVDTMAAHLAGALGRPVWLALDDKPDWRWMLGRADSPWYASLRLFRQPVAGDWSSVVAAMAQLLRSAPGV
jgi:tetratricopeptide (TPR) repeat protein